MESVLHDRRKRKHECVFGKTVQSKMRNLTKLVSFPFLERKSNEKDINNIKNELVSRPQITKANSRLDSLPVLTLSVY
jgi:hypothetical protein